MAEQLRRLFARPEMAVVVFAFLLNFVWEFWQVPYYAEAPDMAHWAGIRMCSLATFGDAGIHVAAFVIARLSAGSLHWITQKNRKALFVYVASGMAITVAAELVLSTWLGKWHYADWAPTLPFGLGITPVLQWLIVPFGVVFLARPYLDGMRMRLHARTD